MGRRFWAVHYWTSILRRRVWNVAFEMLIMGCRFQDLDCGKSLLRCRSWDVSFGTSIGAFSAVAPGGNESQRRRTNPKRPPFGPPTIATFSSHQLPVLLLLLLFTISLDYFFSKTKFSTLNKWTWKIIIKNNINATINFMHEKLIEIVLFIHQ